MIKRILSFVIVSVLLSVPAMAQLKLGTNPQTIDGSALLQLDATNRGLLMPRVTATQRAAISSPATGLLVYQTDGTPGFYFYNGSTWLLVLSSTQGWTLTGNTGTTNGGTLGSAPTGNFVGTTGTSTNARDLSLVTNNVIRAQISTAGVLSTQNDMRVNGLTVGRGNGNDSRNTAVGSGALAAFTYNVFENNWGHTAIGAGALAAMTTGEQNTAVGYNSLAAATTGSYNTALGFETLLANTTGDGNTAIGWKSQRAVTTGYQNTAIGWYTMLSNSAGYQNIAIGAYSQLSGNGANRNVSVGTYTLQSATGGNNVAFGTFALTDNSTGIYNAAFGDQSLYVNTTGSYNTGIGSQSLWKNTIGSTNVALGYQAGYNETGSNKLYIANSSSNNLIYGDFSSGLLSINAGSTPSAPGASLQVNAFNASTKGLIVKGASSATANLLELQNSSSTSLFSINNNGSLTLNAFGASAGNTNELRFEELAANGSNYVGFKAPDDIASTRVWTLPSADGSSGQVLSTNGSGTLSWSRQGLTGSATLDFPSTGANTYSDLTITVTGAADGDVVSLGIPNGSMPAAAGTYTAWVSASNTVTIRVSNSSSGALDPASGTFKVLVTKF